ncbi:MAG: iron ABC transporter permease [Bordetella sp.]
MGRQTKTTIIIVLMTSSMPLRALSFAFIVAIALPLLAVGLFGLLAVKDLTALAWLGQTVLPLYVWNSLLLCLGALAVALILGLPPAWFCTQYNFRLRRFAEWTMILPLAMPAYVVAFAYTAALDYSGWLSSLIRASLLETGLFTIEGLRSAWPEIRSLPGACLILGAALSPYVTLLAKSAFEDKPNSLAEVSRSLGLTASQAYFRVVLPVARPAIVAGSALVVMECLADYGTVSFFSVQTLSTGLFKTWFGYGDQKSAALMGLLMLLIAISILSWERTARGRARYETRDQSHATRQPLLGSSKIWVPIVSLAGGVIGFFIPLALLVHAAVTADELAGLDKLFYQAWQTALYGLYALLTIIPIALLIAYGQRLSQSSLFRYTVRMASSGYAVPGMVVAIGLLACSSLFTQLLYANFDLRFTLTATSLLVVGGYLTRFFTVGFSTIEVGLARITPNLDQSARSLGLSSRGVLFHVHWPILRRVAFVASLLVFVDVVKELPLTLVLRPINVETLAVAAYQFAADERLADAALPSIAIALVGLIPLLLLGPRLR